MGTDAAKHVIPAGSDGARRQTLIDLIFSAHDVIPVANATERATVLAALVAAGRNPAVAPVYVDQMDVGQILRNTTTSDANWVVYATQSILASPVALTPATSWGTPTAYQLPAIAIVSGYGQMVGGRVELKTGSVVFTAGTDVLIGTFASRRPVGATIETPCLLHFGTGVPNLGRATVGTDGTVNARSAATATMTAGSSALVILPSLSWPLS